MLKNIEYSILKELDKQHFRSDIVSVIMNKLDTDKKKYSFLSYMINNRNVILQLKDIMDYLVVG